MNNTTICPLCEGLMKYRAVNNSHIWTCEECPAILFEFYSMGDIENLRSELDG